MHPLIRNLFNTKVQHASLAGRLNFNLKNWKKLTQDGNILSIVQGFRILFSKTPLQHTLAQATRVSQEERLWMRKGGIQKVQPEPGQFLRNLFLVDNKDGGHRPAIKFRYLNAFIPYQYFKVEGMYLIKDLLQEKDFLIKVDLKDAYFGIALDKTSKKYISFQWERNLYKFL